MPSPPNSRGMTWQSESFSGARDIIPLAIGVAIYGLAFGLLAAQAGMSEIQVGIMGTTVFAGSSQIVAVERLVAGAGATAAIVAGLALNLRLVLLTASVREIYAGRPWWQVVLGAHLTSDENWALMLSTRAKGQDVGYWYLVGGGAMLIGVWVIATTAGVSFASAIPEPRAFGMDFAFVAAFIAIARSLWRGMIDLAPWLVSIAVVMGFVSFEVADPSWAIVLGALAGAAVSGVFGHD